MINLFGMELEIIEIVKYLAMIGLGGLSIWFKSSTVAQTKAKEIAEWTSELLAKVVIFIKEAEDTFESGTGEAKKSFVVDRLYEMLPSGVNLIITKEIITEIVQGTFDEIQEFVKTTLDKAVESIDVPTEE